MCLVEDIIKLHKGYLKDGDDCFSSNSGTTSFCVWDKDTTTNLLRRPNAPCHGALKNLSPYSSKIGYITTTLMKNKLGDDLNPYLNWLINDSPYSSCFLSKDASKVISDGVVVTKTSVPSNLMLASLQAFRRHSENSTTAKFVCEAIKQGVNPSIAYFISYRFCKSQGKNNDYVISYWDSDATPFHYISTLKYLLNFVNNKIVKKGREYSTYGSYSYVMDCHRPLKSDNEDIILFNAFIDSLLESGDGDNIDTYVSPFKSLVGVDKRKCLDLVKIISNLKSKQKDILKGNLCVD